jgi:hypothetical protein
VSPVRYEHLHIIKYSYPLNRPWGPISVSPVRYEHLHIEKQSCPRNRPWGPIGMFPERYNQLDIKNEIILCKDVVIFLRHSIAFRVVP